MQELTEYLPIIRQVRSLGRFAIFFLLCFWNLHDLFPVFDFQKTLFLRKKQILAYSIFFFAILVICLEGIDMHRDINKGYQSKENVFNRNVLANSPEFSFLDEALKGFDPEDYQAIVPFPFIFSTDVFSQPINYPSEHFTSALILSYHSGLPLTATNFRPVSGRGKTLLPCNFLVSSGLIKK